MRRFKARGCDGGRGHAAGRADPIECGARNAAWQGAHHQQEASWADA